MLEGLQQQVLDEGEAEAATYNKFSCFCKDTTSDKAKAIEEGSDEKSALTAEIGDLQSDRDGLDTSIQKKQEDIKKAEEEISEESDRPGARPTSPLLTWTPFGGHPLNLERYKEGLLKPGTESLHPAGFPSGVIRENRNDTEKIVMAPAQG